MKNGERDIYVASLLTDDEEELPLNLSTKNRQIWSPGSACEREQEADSPASRWDPDECEAPLELVKRCRSSPDPERAPSAEPRRCPSAPAHHTYPMPHTQQDLNYSLLIKNENKNEKSFQVCTQAIFNYKSISNR